jgi:hypothetical protein
VRYKQDASRELYSIEQKLKSQRKTARDTVKPETAAICDKVIVSLDRQARALREEILTLPDKPENRFYGSGNFACLTRTTPLTPKEIAELEVPEFLRRA